MSFIVMDALGRIVKKGTAAEEEANVDLSSQPSGLYLVRLWGNDTFVVERIIRE